MATRAADAGDRGGRRLRRAGALLQAEPAGRQQVAQHGRHLHDDAGRLRPVPGRAGHADDGGRASRGSTARPSSPTRRRASSPNTVETRHRAMCIFFNWLRGGGRDPGVADGARQGADRARGAAGRPVGGRAAPAAQDVRGRPRLRQPARPGHHPAPARHGHAARRAGRADRRRPRPGAGRGAGDGQGTPAARLPVRAQDRASRSTGTSGRARSTSTPSAPPCGSARIGPLSDGGVYDIVQQRAERGRARQGPSRTCSGTPGRTPGWPPAARSRTSRASAAGGRGRSWRGTARSAADERAREAARRLSLGIGSEPDQADSGPAGECPRCGQYSESAFTPGAWLRKPCVDEFLATWSLIGILSLISLSCQAPMCRSRATVWVWSATDVSSAPGGGCWP